MTHAEEPLQPTPEVDGPATFELEGVRLDLPGAGRVLDAVDLSIPAGRVTALVGASGSGKTSLLRLLNRLEEPTAGMIRFQGRPLEEYPVRDLRRRVGFIFQNPTLFAGTVRDNLRIGAELGGLPDARLEERLQRAITAAELEPGLLDRGADRLSGGERQRVTIARALVAAPHALLMDEPTSALDPETADRLVDTIRRMSHEGGLTVVLVTHRYDEARRVGDVAGRVEGGRITAFGAPARVLARIDEGGATAPSARIER